LENESPAISHAAGERVFLCSLLLGRLDLGSIRVEEYASEKDSESSVVRTSGVGNKGMGRNDSLIAATHPR